MKYLLLTLLTLSAIGKAGSSLAIAPLITELTQRYSERRWSEFFGLAWYLRKSSNDSELKNKIATLESMALIRHCQTDLARGLAPSLKNQKSENFRRAGLFVEKWIELTADTTLKKNTDDTNRFSGGIFKKTELIPFGPKDGDLSHLDPLKVRRPLKNLCNEETAQ